MASGQSRSRYIGVELKKIQLILGDRPVLRRLDWHIRPGQRWVLLGHNGAGKTQLMKLLAGDVWPTPSRGAERRYDYRGERITDPCELRQEIAYLGAERQDRYEHYDWNQRVEAIVGTGIYRSDIPLDTLTPADRLRVARLLRRLHIDALARRRFLTLSYGERRLVLLARALAWAPKLLLLDELFTGLDETNRARAQHCLRLWSRSMLPWVFSTHRLAEMPASATHVARIEAGRLTLQAPLSVAVRRALQALEPRARTASTARRPASAPQPLLTLRRATVWRDGAVVLRGVSLQIKRGECWIVHGSNGSGKSSLLQLLYGDLAVASGGSIQRAGVVSGVSLALFKRRVGLVAPELQAIHPRYLSVQEVVDSGLHSSVGLDQPVRSLDRPRIARALRRAQAARLVERRVGTLSYGQMRRVLFARALVHEPDMLLLDEPYAGLDAHSRGVLQKVVEREIESGVTVVLASHHRDEWPPMASHELQLQRSWVIYCGPMRGAKPRTAQS